MRFEDSPFYGARVNQAKANKGWLSSEEFDHLSKQEYQDFLSSGYGHVGSHGPLGQPTKLNAIWVIVLILLLLTFLH